jgi:hypothetical protein
MLMFRNLTNIEHMDSIYICVYDGTEKVLKDCTANY